MSVHIEAKKGDIAEAVLLPGDPLRAKFVAENYLENPVCYNNVRGMYGYTGQYKGVNVSVQGTGMGLPSISIYVNELISEYGAKKLIRIGSCGSMQREVPVRSLVLAMSASTDSNINNLRFRGMNYAPTADFSLFKKSVETAEAMGIDYHSGSVLSSDTFYQDDPDEWKLWASFGIKAVEMEAAALYTLAAKFGVQGLALLTVSDHLVTGEVTTSEEREKSFTQMMELALETLL